MYLALAGACALAAGSLAAAFVPPALAGVPHVLYVSAGGAAAGSGKSCASAKYSSVQDAVNAAVSGDTVYLCGGLFPEQVFVGKSITVTGAHGSGLTAVGTTFSSSASDYPSQFAADGLFEPQALLVSTARNVTVSGLKITGPIDNGTGNCAQQDFGILALAGSITLKNDTVANILPSSATDYGCQYGVGIEIGRTYWPRAADFSYATEDFAAKATISGVTVTGYDKNGITVDGPGSAANISDSTVTGAGATSALGSIIAQNGIQISRGATGSVVNAAVAGNAYSGSGETWATGVLVYGGFGDPVSAHVTVRGSKLTGNDVAIDFDDYNSDGTGPAVSATRNTADDNRIFSAGVTNTSGLQTSNDGWIGYQAGIQDIGDNDSACGNAILGAGYAGQGSYDAATLVATPGPDNAVVRPIDAGYTFPTTNFSVCNSRQNYGGGIFGPSFFRSYDKKLSRLWFLRK